MLVRKVIMKLYLCACMWYSYICIYKYTSWLISWFLIYIIYVYLRHFLLYFPDPCAVNIFIILLVQIGTMGAQGYCVNVPWSRGGVGDNDYIFAFQQVVLPIGHNIVPHLCLVPSPLVFC